MQFCVQSPYPEQGCHNQRLYAILHRKITPHLKRNAIATPSENLRLSWEFLFYKFASYSKLK